MRACRPSLSHGDIWIYVGVIETLVVVDSTYSNALIHYLLL